MLIMRLIALITLAILIKSGQCSVSTDFLISDDLDNQPNHFYQGDVLLPGQSPYLVSLRYLKDNQHFCGGSIIARRLILTASSCFTNNTNLDDVLVRAGSMFKVEEKAAYFRVNNIRFVSEKKNGLAILELDSPLPFSTQIGPIAVSHVKQDVGRNVSSFSYILNTQEIYDRLGYTNGTVIVGDIYCEGSENIFCVHRSRGAALCQKHSDAGWPLINEEGAQIGVATEGKEDCNFRLTDAYLRTDNVMQLSS